MKRNLLIVSFLLLFALILSACGGGSEKSTNASTTGTDNTSSGSTDLDGKSLVETRCTECHSLNRATSYSGSIDNWTKIVDDMVKKGADLNNAEKEAVINYMAETYP